MKPARIGAVAVTHEPTPPARLRLPEALRGVESLDGVGPLDGAGRTDHFEAFYAHRLGETGRDVAARVLDRAERDLAIVAEWFGVPLPDGERAVVVLARLTDEARSFRFECAGRRVIVCDVHTTPRAEPLQSSFHLALQLAHFHAARRWDAVLGGALARVLATAMYPKRIAGFATAACWLDGDRDDLLDVPLPDTPAAMGCAVLFFNYLHHQCGVPWAEIARSPRPTLAGVADAVAGPSVEPKAFFELLDLHVPRDRPCGLWVDNPFPLAPAAPVVAPVTAPVAASGTGAGPQDAVAAGTAAARTTEASAPPARARRSDRHDRRVCLLTGASGRLGEHLCRHLGARFDFAAVHRARVPVDGVFAIQADLVEDGAAERVVEATLERYGRIDVVVNAAVSSIVGPMIDSDLDAIAPGLLVTNVVVPLRVACAAARRFWAAHTDENRAGGRHVVNLSSVSSRAVFSGEGQSVYAASKAALDHLTAHMAVEFDAIGVRVNAIAPTSFPGHVATERVAAAICALDGGTATGELVVVDGDTDRTIRLLA